MQEVEIMKKHLYVMFLEKTKIYNKMNKEAVIRHVNHIRNLDEKGKIELCGPFKGYPGVGGMIILKTETYEEAEKICKTEPLVVEGYTTYKLVTLQIANKENNYLL